jgi:hypothetical protein
MKINEVMVEASVNSKVVGRPQAHANQKANIDRSAAFRKQMDAPSAEEPATAATAAPAKTNTFSLANMGGKTVTPAAAKPAAPTTDKTTTTTGTTAIPGRTATGVEASNIVGSNFMKGFAQGVGSDALAQAANAASGSNISAQAGKDGVPATSGEVTQDSPVTTPAQEPAKAKQAGAAPDKETTLANPIAKPVAAPAAKGKTMTKQEILAWISRNDEDNAALQSFKDGITAAEKTGAGAATTAATTTDKSAATATKLNFSPKTNAKMGQTKVTHSSNRQPVATANAENEPYNGPYADQDTDDSMNYRNKYAVDASAGV